MGNEPEGGSRHSPVKHTQCIASAVEDRVMSHTASDLFLLAQKNTLFFASLGTEPEKITHSLTLASCTKSVHYE